MRLNDIAAMPAPGRQIETRHSATGREQGFGDLLDENGLVAKNLHLDIGDEEVSAADRPGRIADALMTDGNGERLQGDAEHQTERTEPLRMRERISIDWLALRMPANDASDATDETETTDEVIQADPELAVTSPVASRRSAASDDGTGTDRQMAAAPAERVARNAGEAQSAARAQGRPVDGAAGNGTARDSRTFATPTPEMQTGEPEPAEDRRAALKAQAVLTRPDGHADDGAPRQSFSPIASASVQTVPLPALDLHGPARTVLAALSEHAPEIARPASSTPVQQQTTEPMRILRVQLHPLELGMVTARLSLQGGAMSVELQTETRDAATKLATDSSEIVKALRGLGIEVDRVTVTQSSPSAMQQPDQQPGDFDRSERFADDAARREGAREKGQGPARGDGHFAEHDGHAAVPDRNGVFI